jgi:hypothetical protein
MKRRNYVRSAVFTLDEILPHVMAGAEDIPLPGVLGGPVGVSSLRMQTFKKSIKCVWCGIEGTHFAAEHTNFRNENSRHHLNLWAKHPQGHEVLMTHDHKECRGRGGADDASNTQTMCTNCNSRKGPLSDDELRSVGVIDENGKWSMDPKLIQAAAILRNKIDKELNNHRNKERNKVKSDRDKALHKQRMLLESIKAGVNSEHAGTDAVPSRGSEGVESPIDRAVSCHEESFQKG